MVSAPVLALPNATDDFILDTDASDKAVGAVLSQLQNGEEKVIAYASHTMDKCQRRYCTTRKELLAVITFSRHFRHYLRCRPFIVRTDHNSLVWLFRFKHLEGQLARWLEELSQYDMKIIHRAGRLHSNADGMSRIPDRVDQCNCYEAGVEVTNLPCGGCKFCVRAHTQWARFYEDVDDVVPLTIRQISIEPDTDSSNPDDEVGPQSESWLVIPSAQQLREYQKADPDLAPVLDWLETPCEPTPQQLFSTSRTVKHLWLCKPHLQLINGVLHYGWEDESSTIKKLVVPQVLKQEIMRLAHDIKSACHPGQDKTLLKLKRSVFWPGMSRDVKLFVSNCTTCITSKKPPRKPKAGLGSFHAGVTLERVHIDLLGPLPLTDHNHRYILVLVDQFTKWVECFPLPEQTAEEVARITVTEFFLRLGLPLQIHTDQGKQFEGKLFQSLCELMEVAKTRTTPYHPCSNGQVERVNRTILQSIRCYISGVEKNWDKYLPFISAAIRCTENKTTGFTPNLMMLGREIRTPLEVVGLASQKPKEQEPHKYVIELLEKLQKVHDIARRNIGAHLVKQKRTHDVKLFENQYQKGDLVFKLDSSAKAGRCRKLRPIYSGPLVVTRVLSPVTYEVEGRKRKEVLHHDRLRKYPDVHIPLWLRRKRHQILNCSSLDNSSATLMSDIPSASSLPQDHKSSSIPSLVSSSSHHKRKAPRMGKPEPVVEESASPDGSHGSSFSTSGRRLRRPSYLLGYLTD